MNFPKRVNFQSPEKSLIVVGSKNPVKLAAAETAFTEAFLKGFNVNGLNVSSDVPAQPKGDEETFLGAKNRAQNARSIFPEGDYWVGIEGGIAEDPHGMYAFAWVYIEDKSKRSGMAKTGTFYLPEKVTALVREGMELGQADDQVFDQENSKQAGGSVGLLTKGALDRKNYYTQAVTLALIPFLNENLF